MPVTQWDPATIVSRGNINVYIVPTIADITAPKLTELDASKAIGCSVTNFNATSSVDSEKVDWICRTESEELASTTTHSIDDLTIKVTGQQDDDLITAMKIGDVIYIVRRDGVDSSAALAVGQVVWVWKAVVTSVDPTEATNAFVGVTAHVNVRARTKTPVKVVA